MRAVGGAELWKPRLPPTPAAKHIKGMMKLMISHSTAVDSSSVVVCNYQTLRVSIVN